MTRDNYLAHLAEKINDNGVADIGTLPVLRLVLAYNRRYLETDKVADFDKKVDSDYLPTYLEASTAFYSKNSAALAEKVAEVLGWCDADIVKAYTLGKTPSTGLYNVHTLVSGCEAVDKKESIKAARKIADYSFATSDLRRDYLDAQQRAEFNSKAVCEREIFDSLYARVPGMKEEDFKSRLQALAEGENKKLVAEENRYFPRIVEELVAETVRLTNAANDVALKVN